MNIPDPTFASDDARLLPLVVAAVLAAGQALKLRFSTNGPRFESRDEILSALQANDDVAITFLQESLLVARPQAGWADDEAAGGTLAPGEWWIVDPVEGNINHVHGMADWCVTATLIRDNVPVLTVIHLPLSDETYTALRGCGAWLNGIGLQASNKTVLGTALVGTGQATPGESRETFRRIGLSVAAMLDAGLVLRVSVPSTLQLVHVAAGRMDVFWQFSQVRSGLVSGALLVSEAGGMISDTQGCTWTLASEDFLATAPGLHAATVDVLSTIY